MKKPLLALAAALALIGGLLIATTSASATSASFTVSPWAFACSTTHYGNPASNTDPGPTCDHNGAEAGLGTGYCGTPQGSDVDSPGTVSSAYTGGALTLTKVGPICDDMASGASVGGLVTLTAASADCLTPATCNPGGNLRLNVYECGETCATNGPFHFIGGSMDAENHITFNVEELSGKQLRSIDIIADNPGTVSINNLSFVGAPTPTPTPTPTATPSPTPSASASATPHPLPTVVPVLAQTGGGAGDTSVSQALLGLGFVVLLIGGGMLLIRRLRRT